MNISLTCDTAVGIIIMTRSREEEVSKVKVGGGGGLVLAFGLFWSRLSRPCQYMI